MILQKISSPYCELFPFFGIMVSILSLPSSSSYVVHDRSFSFSFFPKRCYRNRGFTGNSSYCSIKCKLARVVDSSANPATLTKEAHKYFDQAIITVRSGDGGHGTVLSMPSQQTSKSQGRNGKEKEKAKKKSLYKRDFDGSLILPMGGRGGDVVIYADEGKDSLLEFHTKSRYNAKRGGNVDAMGVLTSQLHNGFAAPTLRIPVPIGTVVKRKRGKLLADLVHPGDEILVARGGQGGISLIDTPENRRKKMMSLTSNVMRDESDKVLVFGQPGEEVSLELILRVVADVGLVGLPNAGKSTLLAAITLAKPDIADYPFTTLIPNLGRLDGDPSLGAGMYQSEATLADLPGLIEGAHLGKGLGRNFLRHLRRTRLLVHVVDAAAENPVDDYRTVREAKNRLPSVTEEILRIGTDDRYPEQMGSENSVQSSVLEDDLATVSSSEIPVADEKDKEIEDYPRPLSVVGVSVLKGINISLMLKEIRAALRKCRDPEGMSMNAGG
ncbi:probable GTP-binding protein OBGC2 isoform X2 [Cucumis melo]|uniref:Probable GTP-binding protein OBGC2 isoform X2 n=1 Tax=Cucumis melo TaxID=3656 RepID=A0A1S3CRH4_CUCME|nr:probable GTP-binding protein OBGC2 isoform X2 [Cucumis melo]